MWPTTASRGPPAVPGTLASEEPSVSPLTSAKSLAVSRQAAAGAVS